MEITDELLSAHAAHARDLWLSTLPAQDALPEYTCSPSFRRKMAHLIRTQRRTPSSRTFRSRIKRAAVVTIAAALLLFGCLMSVTAYRERFLQLVIQVYEDLTDFRFSNPASSADTIQLPEIEFGALPDGMNQTEDSRAQYRRTLIYENADGQFFRLSQNIVPPNGFSGSILDTEDSDFQEISLRGTTAYCNQKGNDCLLLWTDGPVIYKLSGNLPAEQLIMIAEKLKIFSD